MMKKTGMLSLSMVLIALMSTAFIWEQSENAAAEQEVKDLILRSYVNGAFNGLDAEAMRKGFHPDFAIFSADGEEISRYPIDKWAAGVEKRKNKPDFDPSKNKWEHNFAAVSVTGGAASVKIELSHQGKHVYTDYLSLLKFDSGWRIVAKVYHKHD